MQLAMPLVLVAVERNSFQQTESRAVMHQSCVGRQTTWQDVVKAKGCVKQAGPDLPCAVEECFDGPPACLILHIRSWLSLTKSAGGCPAFAVARHEGQSPAECWTWPSLEQKHGFLHHIPQPQPMDSLVM